MRVRAASLLVQHTRICRAALASTAAKSNDACSGQSARHDGNGRAAAMYHVLGRCHHPGPLASIGDRGAMALGRVAMMLRAALGY